MNYFDTHDGSPFVDTYLHALSGELDAESIEMLDECESTARYLLTVPVYADDAELIAFRDALHAEIERRSVDANPFPNPFSVGDDVEIVASGVVGRVTAVSDSGMCHVETRSFASDYSTLHLRRAR